MVEYNYVISEAAMSALYKSKQTFDEIACNLAKEIMEDRTCNGEKRIIHVTDVDEATAVLDKIILEGLKEYNEGL